MFGFHCVLLLCFVRKIIKKTIGAEVNVKRFLGFEKISTAVYVALVLEVGQELLGLKRKNLAKMYQKLSCFLTSLWCMTLYCSKSLMTTHILLLMKRIFCTCIIPVSWSSMRCLEVALKDNSVVKHMSYESLMLSYRFTCIT